MNLTHLPNIITSIRIILLIPLSFYLYSEDYKLALVIFFIAGFSDALDGYLAKKYNWISRFGSILDPIADKALLVITMFILTINYHFSWLFFSLVAARDIYIIFGAYFYYKNIGPFNMEPSYLSKLNTFMQILTVTTLLVSLSYYPLPELFIEYLVATVYLTVIGSCIHYTWVWGRKYQQAKRAQETES